MEKFVQAHSKNMAAAKRIADYESSSEDDIDVDEKTILAALYQHYKPAKNEGTGTNDSQLQKTTAFLENALHSGSATCLICIGSIRRNNPIWSCKNCYGFFHLNCIQRWANDSLMQLKVRAADRQLDQGHYNHLGQFIPPKRQRELHWCCPKCRKEYDPKDKPTTYECFCGNEINPQPQPFLIPHSCGEICNKQLQPNCGHTCKMLCHPGPCAPCAQYAQNSCQCGKNKRSGRCLDKNWQCQTLCKALLSCGKHVCNQLCHLPGKCAPCKETTNRQPCECGREFKDRNCSDLKWNCQRVCGAKYACGVHKCRRVCHAGVCGECPLGLPRTCPCGKTSKIGPCTQTIENCGDTCQKLLICGLHTCTQRCHRGACNECLVIVKKECRCGMHMKELPCSKEFVCETKCKQMRDCGKHLCNRKCCDSQCPPCEKICGKQLTCNKHKCQSVCHNGPCYPCNLQSNINCRCGKTKKTVPCGRERNVRIACKELCRITSKCHHPTTHRCHKGNCPACNQKCGLKNSVCGHVCLAKCHVGVRVKLATSGVKESEKYEFKNLPHPRCEENIPVTCIGGHEVATMPCWNSKPTSCQRKCKRLLLCGSHSCELICHSVPDIHDKRQQAGCAPCEEGCNIPRSTGCTHPCKRPCHLPPCAPCSVIIKTNCHCGISQVAYKCNELFSVETEDIKVRQEKFKSCGNRCLKNFPCGHRCTTICHSGKCPNPELCRKKVKIFCICKKLKLEISCDKYRSGQTNLPCDDQCFSAREKAELALQAEKEQLRREEEDKNRIELEKFEKKFGKRKVNKERKVHVEKNKTKTNWKLIGIVLSIFVAVFAAVAVAFYAES